MRHGRQMIDVSPRYRTGMCICSTDTGTRIFQGESGGYDPFVIESNKYLRVMVNRHQIYGGETGGRNRFLNVAFLPCIRV